MKHKLMFGSLTLLALSLAITGTAQASNTWYVDGVKGSDNNDCKSPQSACKTIGHAISLAASGDLISVAAATYSENLKIAISFDDFRCRRRVDNYRWWTQRYRGHDFSS